MSLRGDLARRSVGGDPKYTGGLYERRAAAAGFGGTLTATTSALNLSFNGNPPQWQCVWTPHGVAIPFSDSVYMVAEDSGSNVWVRDTGSAMWGVIYDPVNDYVIGTGGEGDRIFVLDAATGAVVSSTTPPDGGSYILPSNRMSDAGIWLVFESGYGGTDEVVAVSRNGTQHWFKQSLGSVVMGAASTESGKHLVGLDNGTVIVWDNAGNQTASFLATSPELARFDADDNIIVVGNASGAVDAYDYSGSKVWAQDFSSLTVTSPVNPIVGPYGDVYAAAESDGTNGHSSAVRLDKSDGSIVWSSGGILTDASGFAIALDVRSSDGKITAFTPGTIQYGAQS